MRKIPLHGVFDEEMGKKVCGELEECIKNKEKEVLIDINSPGGIVSVLENIIDMIDICRKEKIKVHTYNSELAASCGAMLLSYGDRKISHPTAQTMIHEVGIGALQHPSVSDLEDIAKDLREFNDKWFKWLAKNMGMSKKKLEKLVNRKDWWMDAKEALKFKVINEIGFE